MNQIKKYANKITLKSAQLNSNSRLPLTVIATALIATLTACGGSSSNETEVETPPTYPTTPDPVVKKFQLVQGTDKNSKAHPLLSANPGGPGGSSNQSLRAGDILTGDENDNIIIGGLGVDVLMGYEGDDIMIGGTEDFNSNVDGDKKGADNRDRALGHNGNDAFIWSPGDGSDFFDGGDGIDVVIFGVLGEAKDDTGNTQGAPFFSVNPPSKAGSQDFDGIYLDENNQPTARVSESPGFCTVLDAVANESSYSQLKIDNIVQFSIRNIADQFDAGTKTDDDGLRVSLTLKNTEYVVCTKRVLDESNATNNIEVLDISGSTPVVAALTDLPEHIQAIIQ